MRFNEKRLSSELDMFFVYISRHIQRKGNLESPAALIISFILGYAIIKIAWKTRHSKIPND